MKYIYQILSYAVVIIITAIVVSNLKFASNLDYKNEIENLHKQNDSLKANIDGYKQAFGDKFVLIQYQFIG